jgi:hypothetical protein
MGNRHPRESGPFERPDGQLFVIAIVLDKQNGQIRHSAPVIICLHIRGEWLIAGIAGLFVPVDDMEQHSLL